MAAHLITSLLDHAVDALVVAAMTLLTFLVRSFFSRIHEDLKGVRSSIDKLEGRLQGIQESASDMHTRLAVTRQEVSAIWRYIDGAHKRASDLNGDGED